jgi:hypothetical protein
MKSSDGKAFRAIVCRNGFASGLWLIDELENAPAAWTSPAICQIGGGDATLVMASSDLVQANLANAANQVNLACINSNPALTLLHTEYYGSTSLVTGPTVINDMASAWPMFRVGAYVRPGQAFPSSIPIVNGRGYLGQVRDLWWMQSQLAEGDGIPAAGTRNLTVLGDLCFPWNTTAITLA